MAADKNTQVSQVLITGAGLITPLGLTRDQTWKAVCEGQCGMGPLTALEQPLPPGRNGGQCPDLPEDFAPESPREVRYLRRAIAEALADAGVEHQLPYPAERCGILLGTTLHGMRAAGQFLRTNRYETLSEFLAGATLAGATNDLSFRGFSATTCSACSSSLGSIALAVTLLRAGQLDLVVAGGYDTISEYVYAGFNSLRLVADGPLRPFTRRREGMKLAEGYGIVVLERAGARRRDRKALATILGFGESADAHHLTQPHPQGEGAARAVAAALSSAGLSAGEIDLIAAHATGTPDNDAGEFAALSRVFCDDLSRVPVVAFKSHLGHTLGGAGAVELILSALCLRDQIIPGCPNVRDDEIEFANLRVSTGPARPGRIRATLNTSLGFGGANTCMVLGSVDAVVDDVQTIRVASPEAGPSPAPSAFFPRDVYITGMGVVLPGAVGNEAFIAKLSESSEREVTGDTGPIPESDYVHLLNARRVRRMSDYVKLTLAATMLACRDAGVTDITAFAGPCCAILGSTHGSTNYSEQYYRQIVEEGITGANPLLFAEGVPNAAAAHLSLMLSLKGPCQTVIGTRTAGLDALRLAATRIASGEWDRAIVGAAEEYSPLVNNAYREWGLYSGRSSVPFQSTGGFATGCGAVTFILESSRSVAERHAKIRGRVVAAEGPVTVAKFSSSALRGILKRLGSPLDVLSSANGTWLDRLEHATLRRPGQRFSTLVGYLPECFSVTPMAGIAAVLLTGALPRMIGASDNAEFKPAARFAVLASDYTRLMSGVLVERAT